MSVPSSVGGMLFDVIWRAGAGAAAGQKHCRFIAMGG